MSDTRLPDFPGIARLYGGVRPPDDNREVGCIVGKKPVGVYPERRPRMVQRHKKGRGKKR